MDLKKLTLFKLIEQNKLSIEEAKILNAIFEKTVDFMQIAQTTRLETKELTAALRELKKKNAIMEKNGKFSADFLEVMEKLLEEKEQVLA